MKFTGTIDTWITSTGGLKFLDIVDMADGGKGDQAVGKLHYVNHDMSARIADRKTLARLPCCKKPA
jgi:hypothetical protein